MRKVNYETIRKQYDSWHADFDDNDARGRQTMEFVQAGEQWEDEIISKRTVANKESLTLNLSLKHSRRLKAQSREIDFTINIAPSSTNMAVDVGQLNTYKLLLSSILLADDNRIKFGKAFDQCADYGYSFLELNYDYENDQSLCYVPVLLLHRDPSIAFWDKRSSHPNKIDGRFCGLLRTMTRSEIISKYKKYKKDDYSWLKDKDNEVIDYWYRDYKEKDFLLLTTGIYKRADQLGSADQVALEPLDDNTPLIKKALVSCIYFERLINEKVISGPLEFPLDDLALFYHPACTVDIPQRGELTFPLIYHLKDAQRLHNYSMSQVATIAKNSSSDKWFLSPSHVNSPKAEEYAKNINKTEGAMVFGGDITTIRREVAGELPASMLNLGELSKTEIDELAGVMIDGQTSESAVVSGVALDKISHNIGLVNVDALAVHIEFINAIGNAMRQMLPRIITEQRTILIKKKDGSGEAIIVNEMTQTGEIKNNIRNINNDFSYEILASPSSAMQKENTLKALTMVYQIDPQAWQLTGDIYMRNLASEDAPELERRVSAGMPLALLKYSQGEISLEQYQQAVEQQTQQQTQQQMQMMMENPQFKSMLIAAMAEQHKAEAAKFDAETKRIKAMGDLQNEQTDQQIKAANLSDKNDLERVQHVIDIARMTQEKRADEVSSGSTDITE